MEKVWLVCTAAVTAPPPAVTMPRSAREAAPAQFQAFAAPKPGRISDLTDTAPDVTPEHSREAVSAAAVQAGGGQAADLACWLGGHQRSRAVLYVGVCVCVGARMCVYVCATVLRASALRACKTRGGAPHETDGRPASGPVRNRTEPNGPAGRPRPGLRHGCAGESVASGPSRPRARRRGAQPPQKGLGAGKGMQGRSRPGAAPARRRGAPRGA